MLNRRRCQACGRFLPATGAAPCGHPNWPVSSAEIRRLAAEVLRQGPPQDPTP